ncbi:probable cation-transporting ATPase 13A3 isoform X1 [Cimex lectularius]|uniref:Cation-transporting ATPase n=2 Tax=Cimex lectularius TaxID=79782 RepID=A0A8I6RFZ9_CIMLE|nr:probable cation-transporting ATPase 13A3 isoform X1 [Cimex lectularius]
MSQYGNRNRRLYRWEYEPFYDGSSQSLDTGAGKVKCKAYKTSKSQMFVLYVLYILSLGILYLFVQWYPQLKAILGYRRALLQDADTILVKDKLGKVTMCPVVDKPERHFDYQLQRYVWHVQTTSFILLVGKTGSLKNLISSVQGISQEQRNIDIETYGSNEIKLQETSVWKLLINEVLNPFYVFEILSIILWTFDEYYHYAICVVIMSASAIMVLLYNTKRQNNMLKKMVAPPRDDYVIVLDDKGTLQLISSSELVPGDIISIPKQGCLMTCDAMLVTGSCIVNESVLTGESVPVTKIPPPHTDEDYDPGILHAKHTLYCGTQIIQTRYYNHDKVLALVVRTGSMTAKGQLVRSIIFPKGFGFDFYRDAIKYIIVMFFISLVGVICSMYLFINHGSDWETVLLRSLDIVTIVVPPALPAAMTVGTMYAQNRLKKKGIFCTSPPRINVAGKVKLVCFDKTGTLTEEGLSVWGVLTSDGRSMIEIEEKPESLPIMSPLLHAMASCHSLTKIEGELCGDPLDLSMFKSTEWDLVEPGLEVNRFDQLTPTIVKPMRWQFVNTLDHTASINVPLEIGIVRQFHFNSNVQTMSVIARQLAAKNYTFYTKGAPERVLSMCKPKSVPSNITITLSYYTSAGYRVIAFAYKELPARMNWLQVQRIQREQLENDLEFLGLLIMRNTLKEQSAPVIRQLQQARIKCLMLTGDNMLTAVSVSRDCGLLLPSTPLSQVVVTTTEPRTVKLHPLHSSSEHVEIDASSSLAVDGTTWTELNENFPGLVPQVATRSVIFARMSPQQKAHVVETLQSLDYIVAMVGDGANDCGALKTAHIGISISAAEASIAAPFTSSTPDVTCVPTLILEGRCALVTNFGLFNFMAMYSLIQFTSVLILYLDGIELGTMQFLYVDLVITTSLAVVMGRSKPSDVIVPQRPISTLISPSNIIPLFLQVGLSSVIQVISLHLLRTEHWFRPIEVDFGNTEVLCWENTTIFIISCFQYVIISVAYSKGKPHRESIYNNFLFMITVIGLIVFNITLLFVPFHLLTEYFELENFLYDDTVKFRLVLLGLVIVNLVISLIIEHTVTNSLWLKWCVNKIRRKKVFKNKYKIVETQILTSRFWDPMSV